MMALVVYRAAAVADGQNPRVTRRKIEETKIPAHLQDRYERAEAASENNFV